jgi:oligoribonuclease
MPEESRQTRIVWMDLEMTGLDPDYDEIIEIATIVTDGELNVLAEGPELVVHQPESRFEKMDSWNQEHHVESGLWRRVQEATLTIQEAEELTLNFLKVHVDSRTAPLAGNTIWQDRRFMAKHMRQLDRFLHYRLIDVSSFKEITNRWYPNHPAKFSKQSSHRALNDIKDSIEELKFYRGQFFR